MNPENILVYVSLAVSIAVLFFIIWDHIKDDRILAREVQELSILNSVKKYGIDISTPSIVRRIE